MTKEDSIYCLDCISLMIGSDINGSLAYCHMYNRRLRFESMPGTHHKGSQYPVKCLECIQGMSGNYVK